MAIRPPRSWTGPNMNKRQMIPFDSSGAFLPAAKASELRRLAVRGAAATVSAQGVGLAVQVTATVVLGRLLAPADFGLLTMVTMFHLLLVSFGLNGFTEAVIQCEEIDHYTVSNLFWLNLSAGLILALALAASGPLLARLYHNPLVTNVAVAVALTVFIAAASVIHLALLKRAMRFTTTSANDVVGRAANVGVAVLLALRGWGYWALVAGIIAQHVTMTVGAWWLCRWMPSLPRRTGRTRPLIRFAARVYGRFCIRYSTQNVDNLLIGWQFNAGALGFYKRAYDLFALSASQLITPLHDVALSALSRQSQDSARLRRNLVNSLGILAFVGMAVGADLTLAGKDVVRLLLGPKWDEAGAIFVLFGPGVGIMILYNTVGWIHLSIGRPDRWLRWSILEFVVTGLLFIAALRWGPEGIAVAWTMSFWALLIPAFWYAGRPIGFRVGSLIHAMWKYAVASLVAGVATTCIVRRLALPSPPANAWAALEGIIVNSAVFVALYLVVVILLHRGFAPLRQVGSLMGELVPFSRPLALRVTEGKVSS